MIAQKAVSNTAVRLVTPGPGCKIIILQNNGAVHVRLSLDGNTDTTWGPENKVVGTAPTTTTGYRLAAGNQLILSLAQYPGIMQRNIWAISEGASVNIDVVTDDKDSQ